ncbi:MAG: DUF4115 domain-containing protein, partial [Rhodospirillaceae bacterium]|nr:DUF4115 domain-containing protein [Rhodospirillaceae bacterium]
MAEENQTPPSQSSEGVGALLKSHREKAGKEIVTVAGSLRISARYLEAIEEGRNSDLPGITYAVGFVRSYAEHLGLDEDEIVRRFKEETSEFSPKSELVFPKPIPEGGVPGGVILLGGAVLALVAYGIWYISTSDEQVASSVEPVPQRIVEETEKTSSASPQEGSKISIDENVSDAKKPEEQASASGANDAKEEALSELAKKADESETANTPAVEAAAPAEPVSPPEQVSEQVPEQAQEQAQQQAQQQAAEQVAEEPVAQTQEPAPVVEAQAEPQSQSVVKAPATGDSASSRITVRAKTNSWIQVRDEAEDKLMFTRLLRKGNEYNVPDRSGLTLLTGNAGA